MRSAEKSITVLAAVILTASSCTAIDSSKPPEPGAVRIAGHPYWTIPGCKRQRPFGKWDDHCDVPSLGLPRGFANSDFYIEGPSMAGIGVGR
jgi:hypothetical protein